MLKKYNNGENIYYLIQIVSIIGSVTLNIIKNLWLMTDFSFNNKV